MEYTIGLLKYSRRTVSTPAEAMKILERFRDLPKEVMVVIHLKPDLSSESLQKSAVGTSEACCFETSDIYREAIVQEASGIIMAHSHPWQRRIRPSAEDIKATRSLAIVGKEARMPLIDHIVFGKEDFYSFRARGKVLRASPIYEIQKRRSTSSSSIKSSTIKLLKKMSTSFFIR